MVTIGNLASSYLDAARSVIVPGLFGNGLNPLNSQNGLLTQAPNRYMVALAKRAGARSG